MTSERCPVCEQGMKHLHPSGWEDFSTAFIFGSQAFIMLTLGILVLVGFPAEQVTTTMGQAWIPAAAPDPLLALLIFGVAVVLEAGAINSFFLNARKRAAWPRIRTKILDQRLRR